MIYPLSSLIKLTRKFGGNKLHFKRVNSQLSIKKKHDKHGYISLEKLAEWNIHKSLDKDKDKDKEFECKKVY